MRDEKRKTTEARRPDTSSAETQQLPPYSAPGQEPGDQVAAQRISPSDTEKRDNTAISSADIVESAPQGNDVPDDQDRVYGEGAELYGAYPNHNDVIQGSQQTYGDMESTFSKIGDAALPDAVPKDPAPPSVGPLSVPVALLLALIAIFVVTFLLIAVV